MVSTAGTMLAKSSTKSSRPLSITSSMHARVKSAMNGSHTFTAAGDRNGLRMRRYSDCSGGSISMKPPRVDPRSGIEMPWYPLRSPSGSWSFDRRSVRFEIALSTSWPVTTQKPSCLLLHTTGHCSRSSCALAGYVSRYSVECWSNSTTTRSSVAIEPPGCSLTVRAQYGPLRSRCTTSRLNAAVDEQRPSGVRGRERGAAALAVVEATPRHVDHPPSGDVVAAQRAGAVWWAPGGTASPPSPGPAAPARPRRVNAGARLPVRRTSRDRILRVRP